MAYRFATGEGYGDATSLVDTDANHPEFVHIPDAELLFTGDFRRQGPDLVLTGHDGRRHIISGYFTSEKHPALVAPNGSSLAGDLIDLLVGSPAPAQYAQAQLTAPADSIGKVEKVTGNVTVMRNGVAIALNVGDAVYKSDVVQTAANSSLGISFPDGTALNLVPNTRMALNDYAYDPNGTSNSAVFSLVEGTFAFVAGKVAHTGVMEIATPVATMGIRGTAGWAGHHIPLISSTFGDVYAFALAHDPGVDTFGRYTLYAVDLNGNLVLDQHGDPIVRNSVANLDTLALCSIERCTDEPISSALSNFGRGIMQGAYDASHFVNPQSNPSSNGSGDPPFLLQTPQFFQENGNGIHPFTFIDFITNGTNNLGTANVGSNDTPNQSLPPVPPPPTPPTITIASVETENTLIDTNSIISKAAAAAGVIISGTVSGSADINGQTVTVDIVNAANVVVESYTTTVANDAWSVDVTKAQAQGLSDGSYTVTASLSNATGNPAQASQPLTVDETAPTIAINPIDDNHVVNASEAARNGGVIISGTATDPLLNASSNINGQTVTVDIVNAAHVVVDSYTTTVSNDTWSVDVTKAQAQGLSDGSYTVTASVSDAAGNAAQTSQSLTVDETAPTIAINPIDGNNIINASEAAQNGGVIISGTATDPLLNASSDINGQTVTVDIVNAAHVVVDSYTTTVANDAWSVDVTKAQAQGLNDGSYTVTASVSDAAGNAAQTSQSLTVDETAPTIAINPIDGNHVVNASEAARNGGVIISGTATDPLLNASSDINGQTVTVDIVNAAHVVVDSYTTTVSNDTWSVDVTKAQAQGLSDGSYTVTASVSDAAGNAAQTSQSLTVDETAPTIAINPIDGNNIINASEAAQNGGVIISGTATDPLLNASSDINGQTVTVDIVNAAHVVVDSYTTTVANDAWSVDVTKAQAQGLNDGSYTVTASVSDAAGNAAQTSQSLTVDETAPTIAINPIDGNNIINASEAAQNGGVIISGTATDPLLNASSDINGQTVTVDIVNAAHVVVDSYTTTVSNDTWSVDVTKAQAQGLNDGSYTVTASVSDAAGNAAQTSQSLTVDETVPTAAFDNLSDPGASGMPIPNGYGGLNWSNFYYLNSDAVFQHYGVSGYSNGTVTAPDVAYNGFGATASVSGTTFNFIGADLTAAWNNDLTITVSGYDNNVLVDQETVVVNSTAPTFFNFDFNGITQLVFSSSGGNNAGYDGAGTQFVLENFTSTAMSNPDITIAADGTYQFTSSSADSVLFAGSSGTLVLVQPAAFTGQIGGISGSGDVLDLKGLDTNTTATTGADSYNATAGTTTLTITDPSQNASFSLTLFGDYANSTFNVTSDHNGGVYIADPSPAEVTNTSATTPPAAEGVVSFATSDTNPNSGNGSAVTASVTPEGSDYLGTFSLASTTENAGIAAVDWQFSLANDHINLAPGQAVTQSYEVGITDAQNSAATLYQIISVSIGGPGNDNFVFTPGIGADTIVNFNPAQDTIELDNFANIQNLQQLAPMITSDGHGDAVIELGHNDSITIPGMSASYLQSHLQSLVHL